MTSKLKLHNYFNNHWYDGSEDQMLETFYHYFNNNYVEMSKLWKEEAR